MANPKLSTTEPAMVEPYLVGSVDYSPEEFRQLVDAIWDTNGVVARKSDHLKVVQTSSGAALSITVTKGFAVIGGTEDTTNQGKYLVKLKSNLEVAVPAPPASGSPDIYSVVAYIQDAAESGATNLWALETVAVVPDNAIILAQVTRTAGVANVVNSAISDRRFQARVHSTHTTLGVAVWPSGGDVNSASATDVLLSALQVGGLSLVAGRTYKASFLVNYSSGNVSPTDTERGAYTVKVGGAGTAFDTPKGVVRAEQSVSAGGTAFGDAFYASIVWVQSTDAHAQFVSVTVHRDTGDNTWVTSSGNGSHLEVSDIS